MTRQAPGILFAAFSCVFLMTASTAFAAQSERHVLLAGDREIGYQTAEQLDDGRWQVRFHADDNGRGSKLDAIYRVADDGALLAADITGKSWFLAPVDEHFAISDGVAVWKTRLDDGENRSPGDAFYVPAESLPFDTALLARRLKQDKDHRLPLLPAGDARGEVLRTLAHDGETFDLHAVHGLNTGPVLVWLDSSGGMAAFILGSYLTLIREDLRDAHQEFADAQNTVLTDIEAARNRDFTRVADGLTVFRDVKLFDAANAKTVSGRDVYVFDGRITAVRPTGGTLPEVAEVIEGNGGTLLPGLWDMHAHSSQASDGFQHVAFGVTSVREIGNAPEDVLELRRQVQAGEVIGPRRVLAGFIEGESEFSASTGRLAESLDDALAAVNWYANHGFHQIKVYNSIKPEWVEPMAKLAHERGLRVSGHVPAFMTAEDVVRAGYDEINHINMLFLNFLQRPGDDTRTTLRFSRLGEEAGALDLDSRKVRRFIQLLKERDVAVDPTIAVFRSMMLARAGQVDPTVAPVVERLPATVQRWARSPFLDIAAEQDANYRNSGEALRKMLLRLHEAGVTLVPGTDNSPGYWLHVELGEWVKAGISPAEVLQAATLVSARVAGRDHELGSIERGKLADLVLVDGDPAKDIADLRHIRVVMQGDRLYDAPAMLKELSIAP